MKKLISFSVALVFGLLVSIPSYAIEDPNPKGTLVAGFQVGPTVGIYPGYEHWSFSLGIAPVLTGDYVLTDNWWKGHFTVGAMTGFSWWTILDSDYSYSCLFVAPRAMYGLNLSKKFEVHTGLAVGVGFNWGNGYWEHVSLVYDYIMGARFNLSEQFSLTADINVSNVMPLLGVGVAYKF